MAQLEPKDILVDFLRHRLTDPRSRGDTSNTETFDGDAETVTFSLTMPSGSLSCITAVTVGGTAQSKWADYTIDTQNASITFTTAPGAGTDNVSVTYNYGSTNWVYPDIPFITTSPTSYPRISVSLVGSGGVRAGSYQSDVVSTEHYQATIWVKEDYAPTIDSVKYSNDKLALYFARKINIIFKDYINDIYPKLQNYEQLMTRTAVFSKESQTWQVVFEFQLMGVNVGE